jgi:hypothetical protein
VHISHINALSALGRTAWAWVCKHYFPQTPVAWGSLWPLAPSVDWRDMSSAWLPRAPYSRSERPCSAAVEDVWSFTSTPTENRADRLRVRDCDGPCTALHGSAILSSWFSVNQTSWTGSGAGLASKVLSQRSFVLLVNLWEVSLLRQKEVESRLLCKARRSIWGLKVMTRTYTNSNLRQSTFFCRYTIHYLSIACFIK